MKFEVGLVAALVEIDNTALHLCLPLWELEAVSTATAHNLAANGASPTYPLHDCPWNNMQNSNSSLVINVYEGSQLLW